MSDALVVATLGKIAKKVQKFDKQQFITNIFYKDSALEVEFRNGFKQKFPITYNIGSDKLDLENRIDEVLGKYKQLAEKYNKITKNKELKKEFQKSLLTHKKDFIKKLEGYHQSLEETEKKLAQELQSKLEEGISKIEVRDGKDGRDADNEAIIKSLQEFILQNIPKAKDGKDGKDAVIDLGVLKKELETYIQANITQIKDGKDGEVDYDKIEALIRDLFLRFKENSEEALQKAINALVVPVVKDGKDGRDADEEAILRILKEELQSILNKYLEEKNSAIIQALTDYEQKLEQSVPIIIEKEVSKIPRPKDGKDGVDGRDGKDANTDEILKTLSEKIINLANNTADSLQEQVNNAVAELLRIAEKTKGKKGDKGDKGDSIKGDKGDRGNGIKSAEIDTLGDLIITTDERMINAGRVSIKNFYGGVGGGGERYTNSKPTPFALGGIEKGTRFKDVDLRTLFTKLMYGWEFPEFTAFSIKLSGVALENQLEIGATITGGTYTADWTIANTELLAENSIVIEQDSVVLLENLPNNSPIDLTLDDITTTEPSTISFTISAYDTTGVSFAKHLSVSFMYKIYYGEGAESIVLTDPVTLEKYPNPLMAFRETKLVNTIIGTEYHFPEAPNIPDALPYKWLCCPKAFGELGTHYIFCDLITDIAMVFADKEEITITNEYDLEIPYYCYRTENKIFGEFIMKVKNG